MQQVGGGRRGRTLKRFVRRATLVHFHEVHIHGGLPRCQCRHLVDVEYLRETSAHRHVEQDEVGLVEVVSRAPFAARVGNVELRIGLGIRVAVLVEVHADARLVPVYGKEVEAVLQAVPDLHDVRLAATRPAHLAVAVAHHPEGGPQPVGRVGELDGGFHLTVGEVHLVLRGEAARGASPALVVFPACRNDEAAFPRGRLDAHRHVLRPVGVVLQLIVAATIAVHLDIPVVAVECTLIEVVRPHQAVAIRLARTFLAFRGRRRCLRLITTAHRRGARGWVVAQLDVVAQHPRIGLQRFGAVHHEHDEVHARRGKGRDVEHHVLPLTDTNGCHGCEVERTSRGVLIGHLEVGLRRVIAVHQHVQVVIARIGRGGCEYSPRPVVAARRTLGIQHLVGQVQPRLVFIFADVRVATFGHPRIGRSLEVVHQHLCGEGGRPQQASSKK